MPVNDRWVSYVILSDFFFENGTKFQHLSKVHSLHIITNFSITYWYRGNKINWTNYFEAEVICVMMLPFQVHHLQRDDLYIWVHPTYELLCCVIMVQLWWALHGIDRSLRHVMYDEAFHWLTRDGNSPIYKKCY
jgi:hypothetical protein